MTKTNQIYKALTRFLLAISLLTLINCGKNNFSQSDSEVDAMEMSSDGVEVLAAELNGKAAPLGLCHGKMVSGSIVQKVAVKFIKTKAGIYADWKLEVLKAGRLAESDAGQAKVKGSLSKGLLGFSSDGTRSIEFYSFGVKGLPAGVSGKMALTLGKNFSRPNRQILKQYRSYIACEGDIL